MITAKMADVLIAWAESREPDFIVGGKDNPYLKRHYLFKSWLLGIYVHEFRRSDDDRAEHDHPWPFITHVLRDSYFEHSKGIMRVLLAGMTSWRGLNPWRQHRVQLVRQDYDGPEQPCFTLFIRGPKLRNWGFHCPKGWVPWEKFVSKSDKGNIGKGCAE